MKYDAIQADYETVIKRYGHLKFRVADTKRGFTLFGSKKRLPLEQLLPPQDFGNAAPILIVRALSEKVGGKSLTGLAFPGKNWDTTSAPTEDIALVLTEGEFIPIGRESNGVDWDHSWAGEHEFEG